MKNIVIVDMKTMRGELSRPSFPHQWQEYPLTTPEQTLLRIRDAHIVITNKVAIDAAAINNAHSLELIAVAATGTDAIDVPAARARGISVCNVRHYANRSVSEHVIAMILCLTRRILAHHQRTILGEWHDSDIFSPNMGAITNVQGMRIGIIGSGALGKATAILAEALGMTPTFWLRDQSDSLPRLPLPELLASSDIIALHCPLTDSTQHIINRDTLSMMKRGGILINTARGALVESAALVEALNNGRLGGAGIDVLDSEPPPADEPLLTCRHPNLIITPHVAWASEQSLQIFHQQIYENIEQFYKGTPQNCL